MCGAFSASVCELDAHGGALRMGEICYLPKAVDVIIAPDPETLGRDSPFGCNSGGFDHYEASATSSQYAVVNPVPILNLPIPFGGTVLTHRRNPGSISNGHLLNGDWVEEACSVHVQQPTMNTYTVRARRPDEFNSCVAARRLASPR